MKNIKLLGVSLAVLALAVWGGVQSHPAKADDNNGGNGAAMSQESGNSGNALNSSDTGGSGDNNGTGGGENSSANGPSLAVNASDKIVANGASLVSISGQSLAVKLFGLDLNLTVTSSTTFLGAAQSSTSTIADMKTGDVVDFTGQIDPASGLVSATQVKDETMQQQNIQSIQQQIQALLQELQQLQSRLNQNQQGGG